MNEQMSHTVPTATSRTVCG